MIFRNVRIKKIFEIVISHYLLCNQVINLDISYLYLIINLVVAFFYIIG